MAYERTNWQNGDVISSEKLNKMEAGIEYACSLEHKVTDPTDGQFLKYDAEEEKFVNADAAIKTNIQNPTDGQTLKYDAASGKWVNGEGGGSTSPLIIHIAGNPATMDKTAAEIKAAYPNVVVEWTYEDEGGHITNNMAPLSQIVTADGMEGIQAFLYNASSNVRQAFFTNTDTGYPQADGIS